LYNFSQKAVAVKKTSAKLQGAVASETKSFADQDVSVFYVPTLTQPIQRVIVTVNIVLQVMVLLMRTRKLSLMSGNYTKRVWTTRLIPLRHYTSQFHSS
jgi:hypothetical protein